MYKSNQTYPAEIYNAYKRKPKGHIEYDKIYDRLNGKCSRVTFSLENAFMYLNDKLCYNKTI